MKYFGMSRKITIFAEMSSDKHMGWRGSRKNYCWPGTYHITINVLDRKRQPLGHIEGDVNKPDGDPLAPRVHLSELGKIVEHELLNSIHTHYPMIEVQDYVVMPDHLHFIVVVHRMDLCFNKKLLIVSPWQYVYRRVADTISIAECKTMNCVVQALCRTKDSWWRNSE